MPEAPYPSHPSSDFRSTMPSKPSYLTAHNVILHHIRLGFVQDFWLRLLESPGTVQGHSRSEVAPRAPCRCAQHQGHQLLSGIAVTGHLPSTRATELLGGQHHAPLRVCSAPRPHHKQTLPSQGHPQLLQTHPEPPAVPGSCKTHPTPAADSGRRHKSSRLFIPALQEPKHVLAMPSYNKGFPSCGK